MKFIIASHNAHKVDEFKRIMEPMGIELLTADLPEVEETGKTFMENARLKAESACKATGLPSVADDSGLCVDALNGEPGIYSARYAPPGEGKKTVLKKLEHKEDRGAEFISAIACVFPKGDTIEVTGRCRGSITREILGKGGFGYDPIFLVGDKTFAQMNPQEKDAVSHRGIALREFEVKLRQYLGEMEKTNANK